VEGVAPKKVAYRWGISTAITGICGSRKSAAILRRDAFVGMELDQPGYWAGSMALSRHKLIQAATIDV
jgi:hypothetical protein